MGSEHSKIRISLDFGLEISAITDRTVICSTRFSLRYFQRNFELEKAFRQTSYVIL